MAAFSGAQVIQYSLSNLASNYSDLDGATTTYTVNVIFRLDGSVDVLRAVNADLFNEEQFVTPGGQAANTWVRCTYISGDHLTGGDAENTWHQVNVQRNFSMSYSTSGGLDEIFGVFTFELSDDGGPTIVATKSNVTINVGELF